MIQIYCQQVFKYPQEVLSLCLSSERSTSSLMPTSSIKWLPSEQAPPLALIISSEFFFFFYELSLWLSPLIWHGDGGSERREQTELVGVEKKCGLSLARDRESSSAWRQWAKPGSLLWPVAVYQTWIDAFTQCTTGWGWRGEMAQGNRLTY